MNPAVGRNHHEALTRAVCRQDPELNPDFLEFPETVYDQAFRVLFDSRCLPFLLERDAQSRSRGPICSWLSMHRIEVVEVGSFSFLSEVRNLNLV